MEDRKGLRPLLSLQALTSPALTSPHPEDRMAGTALLLALLLLLLGEWAGGGHWPGPLGHARTHSQHWGFTFCP